MKKRAPMAEEVTRSLFIQRQLEVLQRAFEAGNKNATLRAIQFCCSHKVDVPEWAAKHFSQAVEDFLEMKYRTFDEALGLPKWPKGKHVKAQREGIELAVPVWWRIRQLHDAGEAIDKELFDKVGAEFGISATRAAEYYKWAKGLDEFTRTKLLVRWLASQ